MKITICCVGTTHIAHVQEAINLYINRLKHYIPVNLHIIAEQKQWKKQDPTARKKSEGQAILATLKPGDAAVLLDEKGQQYTSVEFATYLEKKMTAGVRRLVFVIGGAYGFSDEVYERIPEKIALSKMTFSHQMIRGFMLEQIYRAMTILKNEPYHNG